MSMNYFLAWNSKKPQLTHCQQKDINYKLFYLFVPFSVSAMFHKNLWLGIHNGSVLVYCGQILLYCGVLRQYCRLVRFSTATKCTMGAAIWDLLSVISHYRFVSPLTVGNPLVAIQWHWYPFPSWYHGQFSTFSVYCVVCCFFNNCL